jgi:hypothetical protein
MRRIRFLERPLQPLPSLHNICQARLRCDYQNPICCLTTSAASCTLQIQRLLHRRFFPIFICKSIARRSTGRPSPLSRSDGFHGTPTRRSITTPAAALNTFSRRVLRNLKPGSWSHGWPSAPKGMSSMSHQRNSVDKKASPISLSHCCNAPSRRTMGSDCRPLLTHFCRRRSNCFALRNLHSTSSARSRIDCGTSAIAISNFVGNCSRIQPPPGHPFSDHTQLHLAVFYMFPLAGFLP